MKDFPTAWKTIVGEFEGDGGIKGDEGEINRSDEFLEMMIMLVMMLLLRCYIPESSFPRERKVTLIFSFLPRRLRDGEERETCEWRIRGSLKERKIGRKREREGTIQFIVRSIRRNWGNGTTPF